MKREEKRIYEIPEVRAFQVKSEEGFAVSSLTINGGNGQNPDAPGLTWKDNAF